MAKPQPWPTVTDGALVERLVPSLQQVIADATLDGAPAGNDFIRLNTPDVANALLFVLATLLEEAPSCSTPAGTRQMGETVGKELAQLIREARRVKEQQCH